MSDLNENLKNLKLSDQLFKNVKFFVSGQVQDKVIELLKCGGAERMNYFSDYVTHLICGTDAEETDVSDANDLYEIPAVTPKWVIMSAMLNRVVSSKPYRYHNKKLFSNFVFCFSKITTDRNSLWGIITYHGGIVQLNLTKSCTHLVTTGTISAKYHKALNLGPSEITIITPDWIIESARSNSLVQVDLFHPKLIIQPKIIKHESTTAITGFEPDPADTELKTADNSAPDSTQALLDKLKQRMPWNQPSLATTPKDIVPPNVVAPSFTTNRLPLNSTIQQNLQQAQQRAFAQQLQVQSQSQPQAFQTQTNQNIVTANQIARSVVHHTAQGPLIGQPQPQLNMFNQPTQIQLAQSRLQQQQQQRANLISQISKIPHLGQFSGQQIMQRAQIAQMGPASQPPTQINSGQVQQGQINQVGVPSAHLGQIVQPTPQLSQIVGQGHSILQRTQMTQLGKTPPSIQQLQQQLAGRQQLTQQQQQFISASQQQQQPSQPQQQQPQPSSQPLLSPATPNQPFVNISQQPLGQIVGQSSQQQQQHLTLQQNKPSIPSQFVPQNQNVQGQQEVPQQQFITPPISLPQPQHQFSAAQQFPQSPQIQQQQQQQQQQQSFSQGIQQQFVQNRPLPQGQFGLGAIAQQQQLGNQQQQQQQQQQIVACSMNQQQSSPITGQQLVTQVQQMVNQPQLVNQAQQLINQQQLNKPLLLNQPPNQPPQPSQPAPVQQPSQPKPIWQQQQPQPQQQLGIRHPAGIIPQQQQGPRVQWSPGQQQTVMTQRQFIHLDAQTHQQLQQMGPEQRALFIAKLQKQRQLFVQRQQFQMQQQQQQRGGHVLIRSGPVPQGLNPQQQMQWLQQQAKQQGVMLQQSNVQQPVIAAPTNVAQGPTINQNLPHAAPGLSPIQQTPNQFSDQSHLQLQRQQQFRLQQLQLAQREQAQKAVGTPQALPQPPPNIIRPIGQPQTTEVVSPTTVVDSNVAQQQLVVNAKTKTALANMLSIRLQSGNTALGPSPENIAEPSAAGTLRLMTAQHNAALNSNARPQDILGLPQRRPITGPNGELIRPAPAPSTPPTVQPDPPKLQFSPRNSIPVQHRQGPFYGHNPNLKLPPDLFLLGCIFVVVELDRFLEDSIPHWQQQIEKHGGEVEKQYCSRVTHVLCETQRHGVVMQALRDCKRCVTVYWLSDVMKRKQVLPPWTALHLPTMYLDTTPASKHLVSLTGFTNSERNRVKHMIQYIGATFTSYFSKHNTLLIAAKVEGPKVMHAKKWGTPIVNVQWLTDVMLGNFSALNQMEHIKYQQFPNPPMFNFEPTLVPSLMHAWKMPINISQDSYERVKRSASPVVLPKKVKKIKTEHHNDENENPNDQMPPNPTHRILFSMFADTEELKKMTRDLGGSLAKSHQDCTHLVMPYLARSNKLLHCICLGVHILPESWLRDSNAAKKFLDHSNYSLDTKEFNSEYKCDFNQTLATRNRNKLFEGKFFYITPSVYPSKSVLMELIISCGGIVEKNRRTVSQIEATNINSPYSYIILTHANDLHLVYDVLRNKKDKIRTVCNVELIYSAILKQTFEVEPYAVQVCEMRR